MLHPASGLMTIDPFALMRRVARDMDDVMRRVAPAAFPPVNVWQNADAAVVTAELPGVEPGDIEITVKDNVLTLRGERKAPEAAEGAVWRLRERGFGQFARAIRLPFRADPDKVEARFKDGVLRIAIQRPEADKPRRIEIKAS
ncbi:Hsp20/alpha crystallin family protein [Oceanicella actignis]|uniref:HSP20 family protein n=2 Tax=Oceanicella actignis TaxID=1189325 RepID=A0A1M7SRG2_9RHOB|nr:Hsp20/alpha crystallin family protein [Oceanicella actignis]TYO90793.1 HSP20 family protein [Oceanicella actignis]SES67449.1 HSP20 family protein [Oceanicella actignis]SHN60950.1 HSP20 family protein [Oceanicella actignis]